MFNIAGCYRFYLFHRGFKVDTVYIHFLFNCILSGGFHVSKCRISLVMLIYTCMDCSDLTPVYVACLNMSRPMAKPHLWHFFSAEFFIGPLIKFLTSKIKPYTIIISHESNSIQFSKYCKIALLAHVITV